jgi:hypothetical protein
MCCNAWDLQAQLIRSKPSNRDYVGLFRCLLSKNSVSQLVCRKANLISVQNYFDF